MLAHRLTRHVETRAQLVKRLAVLRAQPVEQFPPARVGQRLEHRIHDNNMQPFGCLSSRIKSPGGFRPSSWQRGYIAQVCI